MLMAIRVLNLVTPTSPDRRPSALASAAA